MSFENRPGDVAIRALLLLLLYVDDGSLLFDDRRSLDPEIQRMTSHADNKIKYKNQISK